MRRAICVACTVATLFLPSMAAAQNDWQFPDPYFGAIEFEKSRPPSAARDARRAEPSPTPSWFGPRRTRFLRSFRTRPQPPAPPRAPTAP